MADSVLGVIPARLGSERLPRKPLHLLAGRPLIEWVWRRVAAFSMFDAVVVATDSDSVADVCRRIGAPVLLTASDHPSGTDRVAEVAGRREYAGFGIVVNVQGDEPLVAEASVRAAVDQVRQGWDLGTVATPIRDAGELGDESIVKVIRSGDGAALYFSRAAIPHRRDGPPGPSDLDSGAYLRHIGLYAARPAALRSWVSLPVGRLEQIEKLEQLRPLEAGIPMGVGLVATAERGVDTPQDAARVEQRLASAGS